MSNQNLKKKPQLCETGTCFGLKIPGLNQKQHLCIQMFFSPVSYFFNYFLVVHLNNVQEWCMYLHLCIRNGKVLKKYFLSFSKPAVTTVNKILLLVKYKVNGPGLQQLLSIFRKV